MSDSEEPMVLDRAVFASLLALATDEDVSLLEELVGIFLADATTYIAALREAADAGDRNRVKTAAHTLRGSSGTIGARGMADVCHQLEALASSTAPGGVALLIDRLEQEFGRVRGELETFLPRGAR